MVVSTKWVEVLRSYLHNFWSTTVTIFILVVRYFLVLRLILFIRYDRNKLSITATGSPNWIEELEDDFEDMEEDIETYRCTCK